MNDYFENQYAHHILPWREIKRARRHRNVWYRGKVSRMTQLNQLRARCDNSSYAWLKDFWRRELQHP